MLGASLLAGCPNENAEKKGSTQKLARSTESAPAQPNAADEIGDLDVAQLAALVRSTDSESRKTLERQLFARPSARSWAALGLGLSCTRENAEATVTLLASAGASWMAQKVPPQADSLFTLAWAVGACATAQSETLLSSWLMPDPSAEIDELARAAAAGLGAYADRTGRLTERTQTALLTSASRQKDPQMLFSLGRVARLSGAVGAHLLEVVGELLTEEPHPGRRAAIFALGKAGASAAAPLSQIFLSRRFDRTERAAAAQALAQLDQAGQRALDRSIEELLAKGLPRTVDDERWIPLRAGLWALNEPVRSAKFLAQLAAVPIPEPSNRSKAAARRRLVWLRCRAADLQARDRFELGTLLSCDPDEGRPFFLAQIRVLDRSKLDERGVRRVGELLGNTDPKVAQAALRLLSGHPEIPDASSHLLRALSADAPGTRTTAAQIIATYPQRVFDEGDDGPPEDITQALAAILESTTLPRETQAAALQAAGSLRALTLKPKVQALCDGADPALAPSAESALSLLGSPKSECRSEHAEKPFEAPRGPVVTLTADSDVGPLTLHLDPSLAPQSAAHFLTHVDAGAYDGLAIHGAREGFAVQFGDKNGDGFDDERAPGLPNEVAPTDFPALSFGMGAFAPGTQDLQIFVVVSDAPQLTGSRVALGRAEGPWDQLIVGDVIHELRRR